MSLIFFSQTQNTRQILRKTETLVKRLLAKYWPMLFKIENVIKKGVIAESLSKPNGSKQYSVLDRNTKQKIQGKSKAAVSEGFT